MTEVDRIVDRIAARLLMEAKLRQARELLSDPRCHAGCGIARDFAGETVHGPKCPAHRKIEEVHAWLDTLGLGSARHPSWETFEPDLEHVRMALRFREILRDVIEGEKARTQAARSQETD